MGGPRNLSASEACFPMQTPSFCQEQSCLYGTRLPFRLQARAAVGASIGCKEASCPNRKNLTGSPAGLGRLWVCQQVSEKQVRKEEQWWLRETAGAAPAPQMTALSVTFTHSSPCRSCPDPEGGQPSSWPFVSSSKFAQSRCCIRSSDLLP